MPDTGKTYYCAGCEQHARENDRLRRIIKAWEEGRVVQDTSYYACRDTDACRWCVTFNDGVIWECYNTPAEAYAALEVNDD